VTFPILSVVSGTDKMLDSQVIIFNPLLVFWVQELFYWLALAKDFSVFSSCIHVSLRRCFTHATFGADYPRDQIYSHVKAF